MTQEKWAMYSKRAWGIIMLVASGISQYSSYEIPMEALESVRQIAEPILGSIGLILNLWGSNVAKQPIYWFRKKQS